MQRLLLLGRYAFFLEGVGGAPRSAQHSVGITFGALALAGSAAENLAPVFGPS